MLRRTLAHILRSLAAIGGDFFKVCQRADLATFAIIPRA